jgi:hypothetical protein
MEHRAMVAAARLIFYGSLVASLSACPGNFVNPNRSSPVCAVRDCETGEIIDDGCDANGKCKACSNDCGGKVAPRNGPVSSPFPR